VAVELLFLPVESPMTARLTVSMMLLMMKDWYQKKSCIVFGLEGGSIEDVLCCL
jgi:hypothetical protein